MFSSKIYSILNATLVYSTSLMQPATLLSPQLFSTDRNRKIYRLAVRYLLLNSSHTRNPFFVSSVNKQKRHNAINSFYLLIQPLSLGTFSSVCLSPKWQVGMNILITVSLAIPSPIRQSDLIYALSQLDIFYLLLADTSSTHYPRSQ